MITTLKRKMRMSKFVLVECVSTFRMRYAVELNDDDPVEWALDTVVMNPDNELGQQHLGEQIVSHRVVTTDEIVELAKEDSPVGHWSKDDVLNKLTNRIKDDV